MRTLDSVCVVLLALGIAGCGGGSGTGPGGGLTKPTTSPGGGGGTTTPASATNTATAAHWQVALAALSSPPPGSLAPSLVPVGLDAWNDLIARSWPEVRKMVDAQLLAQLQKHVGGLGAGGAVSVLALRNVTIDTTAPPAVSVAPAAAPLQGLRFEMPQAPASWRIQLTADVGTQITTNLVGIPIQLVLSVDVTAEVSDIRVDATGTLDLSNPARPAVASIAPPFATLRLDLRSQDPFLAQILTPLTQLLDPAIRLALLGGAIYAQQQAGILLAQVAGFPFQAAPPAAGVPGAPALEAVADEIAEVIRRDHMPWGNVVPAIYDKGGYGNGQVVDWYDYGDSVGWTGHFIFSQVLAHDLTGDPRALAGAERGLDGILRCIEVAAPGDGLLSRCVIPLSDPHVATISGNTDYFTGTAYGVAYGSLGDMSRDHYIESLQGLVQAWIRVPSLRPRAAEIATRMLAYLDRNDWNVFKPHSRELSRASPFAQAPGGIWALIRASTLMDPARFQPLHDRYRDLPSILWLAAWGSAMTVHEQYYKFNIGHAEVVTLTTSESDPARYREYVKVAEILHEAVKTHDNAWFDTVYGMAVPAAAPAMGPRVRNALERWTLRPRRCFDPRLDQDPTVAKVLYSSPSQPAPELVAAAPVPIEKRPANDYIWQVTPFQLRGWRTSDTYQYPGVDLVLPYWAARAYGMVQ